MARPLLVTFEGVEGSGKSTLLAALARRLEAVGRDVVRTREPGGTPAGERIRDVVLDVAHAGLDARAELFLMLAARSQVVAEVIRPALARGAVVLCDRYGDASTAYQGIARGLGLEQVEVLNKLATGDLVPDRTYLVDLDPAVGRRRMAARAADRLEQEDPDFHERVREGYRELARRHPARFVVLDGTLSADRLADVAWNDLEALARS
jgi:dTMP kinase